MSNPTPTVVLVHGAFAESASWNGVLERLSRDGVTAIAVANPLRSLAVDAGYVRDVLSSLAGPIVLVGHSYAGMVITEAAAGLDAVKALVYVSAFAPDTGESAFSLSTSAPGSTLGEAIEARPLSTGVGELSIRRDRFHPQFAADLPADTAALMWATQRPVTDAALNDPITAAVPAWRDRPSWHVYGVEDRNIPAEVMRVGAERAGAQSARAIAGASHVALLSQPDAVAATILEAVRAVSA